MQCHIPLTTIPPVRRARTGDSYVDLDLSKLGKVILSDDAVFTLP